MLKGLLRNLTYIFFHTFAHVTRISSIRILIALVAIHTLVIHHMDVKTNFLNGDLEKEIYMTQPKGCGEDGSVQTFEIPICFKTSA